MRSLIITPTPTHPADQGNRARVSQIAGALRRMGPVEVLYSAIDGAAPAILDAMAAAWDGVHVVAPPAQRPQRRGDVWGLDDWMPPHLVLAAQALARTTHYDVVVANYVWCSLLLTCFREPGTLKVLDTHDAFGDRHRRAHAAGLPPHWFYCTRADEARGFDRADLVLAIQPAEAADFAARTRARVVLLEYAAAPAALPARADGPVRVGYFGSGNPWNVASLTAFDALLAQRRDLGEARFLLLGGITGAVGTLQMFQPAGRVAEVADAYRQLDLLVNPMVGGTGLKIKTVEALAHGRPVLATADGGAGLESCGPDVRLPGLTAMADRLAQLLRDPGSIDQVRREQAAAYAVFQADVAGRLQALVAGWS